MRASLFASLLLAAAIARSALAQQIDASIVSEERNAGGNPQKKSYKGGHGWVPFTFYGDRIKEAIEWMRLPDGEAETFRKKLNENPAG